MGVGDRPGAPECSVCSAPKNQAPKPGIYSAIPLSVTFSSEWSGGVQAICDELSREGTSFVEEISHELRAALNDIEEILRMSEHAKPSSIRVILMAVGAMLAAEQLEPVSATVTAILCAISASG
jgi:hypothetical protein